MTEQFLEELEKRIKSFSGVYSSGEWYNFSQTELSKDMVLDLIKEVKKYKTKNNKLINTLEYYMNDELYGNSVMRIDKKSHSIEALNTLKAIRD